MNKRLIIIFVCLALFVLTLVVGAVVFTVNDVDILLNSQENVAFDKAKILNISGIKKGQSVFTINSDKASANIEKQFPELKVIKIERSFPNKVRIHLDTRKAILKMKISNSDSYAVLDRELKIINIVNNDSEMYGEDKVVIINGYSYQGGNDALGNFINDNNNDINALKKIISTLETLKPVNVVNERFSATFDNIDIIQGKCISLKTAFGCSLVIRLDAKIGTNDFITSVGKQCEMVYGEFYKMNDEAQEQSNFIYVDLHGNIQISNELKFD